MPITFEKLLSELVINEKVHIGAEIIQCPEET